MLSKSTKIIINYGIGIGLFAWLSWSLFHQVRYQENLQLALRELREVVQGPSLLALLGVCLMMAVNWGLEARKWQLLVNPLERIPFRRAFYAILSGISLSVNTPNRIGEYGGRILYVHHINKLRAITVTLVGSFSQLIVTILFGLAGLAYYIDNLIFPGTGSSALSGAWKAVLIGVMVLSAVVTLFLYFRLHLFVTLFERIRALRRLRGYVKVLDRFSKDELGKLLLLSVVRYLVFSLQFLILLWLLGVDILWWQGLLMIFLVYLAMALVPTVAIAELGIRGQIGLYFLGLLSPNKVGIIAATFGIWFINLIIPAIVGSVLILGIKVFSDK
ncbi:lysylphosphatidylglycerol synthase domain-containing protein [Compostibacter hankyongensis]|uniref:lysylphosphatidylglycerol synthase domain-containing protein n=1 Tax=Compostibacter hankyongensis TaxID=1007089 RepID=UPI0031E93032